MIARKDIMAALQAVEALACYATPPPAIHAFDAWPQLQRLRWRTYCVVESTWWLLVALPAGDIAETVEAADPLWTEIAAYLNRIGSVDEAVPDRLATGDRDGGQPVMRFTFISD